MYLPTLPQHGRDVTQCQFLAEFDRFELWDFVLLDWLKVKELVYPTINLELEGE